MIEAPIICQIEFPIIAVDDLTGFAKGAIAETVNHIGRAERIATNHTRANGIQRPRTLVRVIDVLAEERIAGGLRLKPFRQKTNGRTLFMPQKSSLEKSALRVAESLAKEGVVVFAVGVGTEAGSEIRIVNEQPIHIEEQ